MSANTKSMSIIVTKGSLLGLCAVHPLDDCRRDGIERNDVLLPSTSSNRSRAEKIPWPT